MVRPAERPRWAQTRTVAALTAGAMLIAGSAALAAGPTPFEIPAGAISAHPCQATYRGRPLFSGRCQVNTRGGETMVFSPADGCTFTFRPAAGGFTGELGAYRNSCTLDAAADRELEDTVRLGRMHRTGACLVGGQAQVCVTR